MATSTWKVHPVYATIVEILEEKGSLSDEDLYEALKAFYKEIGFDELNETLMKMEVVGLVSVSSLTKDRRLVQLLRNKRTKDASRPS